MEEQKQNEGVDETKKGEGQTQEEKIKYYPPAPVIQPLPKKKVPLWVPIVLILGAVAVLGGYAGYVFLNKDHVPEEGAVLCAQDVKKCDDGSFVGRIPPACRFEECPIVEVEKQGKDVTDSIPDTNSWQIYQSKSLGFEFKYPQGRVTVKEHTKGVEVVGITNTQPKDCYMSILDISVYDKDGEVAKQILSSYSSEDGITSRVFDPIIIKGQNYGSYLETGICGSRVVFYDTHKNYLVQFNKEGGPQLDDADMYAIIDSFKFAE